MEGGEETGWQRLAEREAAETQHAAQRSSRARRGGRRGAGAGCIQQPLLGRGAARRGQSEQRLLRGRGQVPASPRTRSSLRTCAAQLLHRSPARSAGCRRAISASAHAVCRRSALIAGAGAALMHSPPPHPNRAPSNERGTAQGHRAPRGVDALVLGAGEPLRCGSISLALSRLSPPLRRSRGVASPAPKQQSLAAAHVGSARRGAAGQPSGLGRCCRGACWGRCGAASLLACARRHCARTLPGCPSPQSKPPALMPLSLRTARPTQLSRQRMCSSCSTPLMCCTARLLGRAPRGGRLRPVEYLAMSRVASNALATSRCGLKTPRCRSRATATWACVRSSPLAPSRLGCAAAAVAKVERRRRPRCPAPSVWRRGARGAQALIGPLSSLCRSKTKIVPRACGRSDSSAGLKAWPTSVWRSLVCPQKRYSSSAPSKESACRRRMSAFVHKGHRSRRAQHAAATARLLLQSDVATQPRT
jgi:hypothetical protein